MSKPMALFFAVISVALLCGISISISFGNPLLVIFFSVLSILFIGFGFMLKARIRRAKQTQSH